MKKNFFAIIFLIAFAFTACGTEAKKQAEAEQEYAAAFAEAIILMRLHTAGAEKILEQVAIMGRSALENRFDFQNTLRELYLIEEMQTLLEILHEGNAEISAAMEELQSPPEIYTDSYAALAELHNAYTQLYNFALSPEGTPISFNDTRKELQDSFKAAYDELMIIFASRE